MVFRIWELRATGKVVDLESLYGNLTTLFSLKVNHGGFFTKIPNRGYIEGQVNYIDLVDVDEFSLNEINAMLKDIGYSDENIRFYHYRIPGKDLDFGLRKLGNHSDVVKLLEYIPKVKLIELFVEHHQREVEVEVVEEFHDVQVEFNDEGIIGDDEAEKVDVDQYSGDDEDDSDYVIETEDIVDEAEVDIAEFNAYVDMDLEESSEDDDIECEVDHEDFDSRSEEDSDTPLERGLRKARKSKNKNMDEVVQTFYVGQQFSKRDEVKELVISLAVESRRQLSIVKNDNERFRAVCDGCIPIFEVGSNAKENTDVNDQKDGDSMTKEDNDVNDKKDGDSMTKEDSDVNSQKESGSNEKEVDNSKALLKQTTKKKTKKGPTCTWVLHVSNQNNEGTWIVKTFINEHKCVNTRDVKLCTVSWLARVIESTIIVNPGIPLKALQEQLQQKFQIQISKMKVFRAKAMAIEKIEGDYTTQYGLLRDYSEELVRRNPGTTVTIDVEREYNPASETRQFRRIYICLGGLKAGFKMCGRDLLGLDGTFMKGPFPGQILTAVGIDSNNGIYPVAYALVESERIESWTWFLECLGQDMDLSSNSNFTFISDRQKGIIQAVAKVFPCAEHRFCLRHIHENMKSKWRGSLFKNLLWKCATSTTVPYFEKAMKEIQTLDQQLYEWLQKIPRKHWSKAYFSGRSKSDVLLNNICEVFNKQLSGGRDKPIITCLEYIREYLMHRIASVNKVIAKSDGLLTPNVAKVFEKTKSEANQCRVLWNGVDKYQVQGRRQEQYIVDMAAKSCTCRRWELTGIPCRHTVAVIYNMALFGKEVGLPDSWVSKVYWLDTWKKVYANSVDPVHARDMWIPSSCPTKLTPPKHRTQVGRPRKKRKKSAEELSQVEHKGKMVRVGQTVTCAKCGNKGHNSRSCNGRGGTDSTPAAASV